MGEGVGKTTAAAGLSLRAAAHGKQVRVLQLLKPEIAPEYAVLSRLANVTVTAANPGIPFFFTLTEAEKSARIRETECAVSAFLQAQTGDFLLVMDEMGGALENGMCGVQTLCTALAALPKSVHVALTGRYFPSELLEQADCISEIRCVRHPYDCGVQAAEGLEY